MAMVPAVRISRRGRADAGAADGQQFVPRGIQQLGELSAVALLPAASCSMDL